MAKDAFGDIILFGGLAVGGYFLYQWWNGQAPVAAPATPAPAPAPPAYQYTPPPASTQLQTAAQDNSIIKAQGGLADAYQWATIYNGISGLPSIANVNINSTFYPNGLPSPSNAGKSGFSSQGLPLITAQVFIQGVTSAGVNGLSGLGQARMVRVPLMLTPLNRTTVSVPAGTTPFEFQQRLRAHRGAA